MGGSLRPECLFPSSIAHDPELKVQETGVWFFIILWTRKSTNILQTQITVRLQQLPHLILKAEIKVDTETLNQHVSAWLWWPSLFTIIPFEQIRSSALKLQTNLRYQICWM